MYYIWINPMKSYIVRDMSLSKVVEVCKVLGLGIGWLVGVGDAHGAWLLGQECVESEVSMQAKRYIATESREELSAVVWLCCQMVRKIVSITTGPSLRRDHFSLKARDDEQSKAVGPLIIPTLPFSEGSIIWLTEYKHSFSCRAQAAAYRRINENR